MQPAAARNHHPPPPQPCTQPPTTTTTTSTSAILYSSLNTEEKLRHHIDRNPHELLQTKDTEGYPLLCAVLRIPTLQDNVALLKWLIDEKGVQNLNDSHNKNGRTPLYFAKSVEVMSVLLGRGASPTWVDMYGMSPLHYHAQKHHHFLVARLLEDNRVMDNINERTHDGEVGGGATALLLACGNWRAPGQYVAQIMAQIMMQEQALLQLQCQKRLETIKILIFNGANPRVMDREGLTPLQLLSRAGRVGDWEAMLVLEGAATEFLLARGEGEGGGGGGGGGDDIIEVIDGPVAVAAAGGGGGKSRRKERRASAAAAAGGGGGGGDDVVIIEEAGGQLPAAAAAAAAATGGGGVISIDDSDEEEEEEEEGNKKLPAPTPAPTAPAPAAASARKRGNKKDKGKGKAGEETTEGRLLTPTRDSQAQHAQHQAALKAKEDEKKKLQEELEGVRKHMAALEVATREREAAREEEHKKVVEEKEKQVEAMRKQMLTYGRERQKYAQLHASKVQELAAKEEVVVNLKKCVVDVQGERDTLDKQAKEQKEAMARKEEVLKKLAAELEVVTARVGEKEKLLVEAKASKEQETSKLVADLEDARAEAAKAREDADDSEAAFARLCVEMNEKVRLVNDCKKTLLEAAGEGGPLSKGPLTQVLRIESLGSIYYDELQKAANVGKGKKKVSDTHLHEIFMQIGPILMQPNLVVIERYQGKITNYRRDIVREALQRLLETDEMKGAKVNDASMEGIIDLFIKKRALLEEICPSGLYAIDTLWHGRKDRELPLEEALKMVVEAYKKATQSQGGGKKRKK